MVQRGVQMGGLKEGGGGVAVEGARSVPSW